MILAHRVVATHDETVVNTLNCSMTTATYSFSVTGNFGRLVMKLVCNASDTGKVCVCVCVCVDNIMTYDMYTCSHQVHSYFVDSPLRSTNSRMGVVSYSYLQPPLPTGKLPEGSECQLYGCATDDTNYWIIEGEKCDISHPGDTL